MKIKSTNTRILPIFFVIFLILASVLSIIIMGQPVIEDMDYTPKSPAPLSTITFKATVAGENPTVYVFVEECRNDLCYADFQNVTMVKIGMTHYTKAVKLRHAFANIVHYQIIVQSEGIWYKSTLEEFNLEKENESIFPSARFVYSPLKPFKSDIITFSDTSTILDGEIVSWKWEFGDGEISYGQNTQHQFNKTGKFTVTLTIKDKKGKTDSYSLEITVGDEKDDETPGFEFIPLILTIYILFITLRKRNHK